MRRKKTIAGGDNGTRVVIAITIDSSIRLGRSESQRLMDRACDDIMRIFPLLPYTNIPLSRLTMK